MNGYPGVGTLTIGRELATLISGRLLDIHTVYNVAFVLTEFIVNGTKGSSAPVPIANPNVSKVCNRDLRLRFIAGNVCLR
ncbi:hypothetical protein [Nitratireductor thuwali]|uniref:Uncharacterized protein n=1 Tax=Nitratireductor thuwali TaxID=2267699 RepID=A0ABY5MPA0_9HYPH|nr:hypothetical protein NTH_02930 [Nitratireductor thuwali]